MYCTCWYNHNNLLSELTISISYHCHQFSRTDPLLWPQPIYVACLLSLLISLTIYTLPHPSPRRLVLVQAVFSLYYFWHWALSCIYFCITWVSNLSILDLCFLDSDWQSITNNAESPSHQHHTVKTLENMCQTIKKSMCEWILLYTIQHLGHHIKFVYVIYFI